MMHNFAKKIKIILRYYSKNNRNVTGDNIGIISLYVALLHSAQSSIRYAFRRRRQFFEALAMVGLGMTGVCT